jgi:arabinogalactan endo-1,4-beta-galactosidase
MPDAGDTDPSDVSYIIGADVSWIQQDEAQGATYFDDGVQGDFFDILTAHAFNFARLWIFVDPSAPGGYAENYSEAFGDRDHTLDMADRIFAAGMGFMLAFHCSDTGASAGFQIKPSSWVGHDTAALEQDLYNHTYNTITALLENGTPPNVIQMGNEIGEGFVRPEGSLSEPETYTALIKAGIAGVRAADPDIPIALHHQKGRDNETMVAWIEILLKYEVDFDIIGASTFAETEEGQYEANFSDLATRYPDYRFLSLAHSGDDIEVIYDVMPNLPDGRGMGAFIWGPTRYGTSPVFDCDTNCSDEEGSSGGRFDTNDYIDLYPQIAERLGIR